MHDAVAVRGSYYCFTEREEVLVALVSLLWLKLISYKDVFRVRALVPD